MLTIPRSTFSALEERQISAALGHHVILHTEYGAWRFLVTHVSYDTFSFISHRVPGEATKTNW
ncbi:hypothetical protein DKM44_03940 [Deinococcus irradiatisoli]|uniref:Uncharacterized protein n=1 Tax=Deinococcus irradiatisoli TaxID=2202254 RepID=A0A2Z3JBT0_9DEIO|nr:hypothetical protein DKM44_03940 [Deinococcus irradiatisoli]